MRHSPFYTDSQVLAFQVLCSIVPTIVALTTIARLYLKGRSKWGWDDLLTTFGVLVMIEQQAVLWSLSMYQVPTLPVIYTVLLSSQTQVWSARGSILASIVRIIPTGGRLRKVAYGACVIFALFYVVTIAQFIWECQTHLERPGGLPSCAIQREIPIYQITVSMIADATLIILPLQTLRLLHGKTGLRRRLQVIFMASALTTIASIVNAGFNLSQLEFGLLVAAEMEAWVSLFVSNLGVLITAIARWARGQSQVSTASRGKTNLSSGVQVSVLKFSRTESQFEMHRVDPKLDVATLPSSDIKASGSRQFDSEDDTILSPGSRQFHSADDTSFFK